MTLPWKVVVVGNRADDPTRTLPFAYTVGVYPEHGDFELWICGSAETGEAIGLEMMGYIVNVIAEERPEPESGHGFKGGEQGEYHIEVTVGAPQPGARERLNTFMLHPDTPVAACRCEVRSA